MKLKHIRIHNFRCFADFQLELAGASRLVIAPNAGGKTSLLSAMRIALRGSNRLRRTDFRDETQPIEIVATLSEIPPEAHGTFANAITFGQPPTLEIGVRATWDQDEAEVVTEFGFPGAGWSRAGRDARENLSLIWLPAWRDPERLVPLGRTGTLLDEIVAGLAIDQAVDRALSAVDQAAHELARAQPLAELLRELGADLGRLIPEIGPDPYSLAADTGDRRSLLRQLELMLEHNDTAAPSVSHSGGLAQLTIFVLALRLLQAAPGALLLVDEPEQALHPHAQRALVRTLRERAGQSIIATHSAAVLDRGDPRHILRLRRTAGGDTEAIACGAITDSAARKLARFATAQTAEAYFARTVVVFEGQSDLLAFRELARTAGNELDGRGVSLLSLEGANVFATYLQLLGPRGLDLELFGLVDADKEGDWIDALNAAGVAIADRHQLAAAGFEVCDPDLEVELLGALTAAQVDAVIDAEGDRQRFDTFSVQPAYAGAQLGDRQLAFVKNNKVRYAPLVAAEVATADIPAPIGELLARI